MLSEFWEKQSLNPFEACQLNIKLAQDYAKIRPGCSIFFFAPRMRTRAASRSPRVRRMGRIPMQRTKVPRGPQPPRTKVPSREPPYRTRPPGSSPTSAAGLRLWSSPPPEDFNSRDPPSGDPSQVTPKGLSGAVRRARTYRGG